MLIQKLMHDLSLRSDTFSMNYADPPKAFLFSELKVVLDDIRNFLRAKSMQIQFLGNREFHGFHKISVLIHHPKNAQIAENANAEHNCCAIAAKVSHIENTMAYFIPKWPQ